MSGSEGDGNLSKIMFHGFHFFFFFEVVENIVKSKESENLLTWHNC